MNLEPINESEIGNDAIIEIIMYDNQVSSFSGIESARDQKKSSGSISDVNIITPLMKANLSLLSSLLILIRIILCIV